MDLEGMLELPSLFHTDFDMELRTIEASKVEGKLNWLYRAASKLDRLGKEDSKELP